MAEDEITRLIGEAKEHLLKGEKDKAKALLIKAVRKAEEESMNTSGFEKFKYTMLINQINSMIKAITSEEENEEQ